MTTVTIGNREFRIGAWYAPSAESVWRKPVRLDRLARRGAHYNIGGDCPVQCSRRNWLRWAGDEVTT